MKRPDVQKAAGPDCDIINKSRAAYAAADLPVSASKAFDLKITLTAWGTQVRSDPGTAGAPRHRRLELFVLTLLLLSAPGATKAAMRSILGSYVHPLSHRKETMCVFSRALKWTNDLQDNKLVSIPVDVKEELLAAASLCP